MGFTVSKSLSLLADALRGVSAPFGGARIIEFTPPLPGGYTQGEILEPSYEVLEALSSREERIRLNTSDVVVPWSAISDGQPSGSLTVGQVNGIIYEGEGVWQLADGQRFRLLADEHVTPRSSLTGAEALLDCLQGNGGITAEAHSLVTLDKEDQFDAICDIVTNVAPALEVAIVHPGNPAVQSYLRGPHAHTPILACRNRLTEEFLEFDLSDLLAVKHCGGGVFELKGQRFGVLALRPVRPERIRKSRHGFTLPRLEFRPPCATLH